MIRKSVAEILDQHVTFELEAIDRMYLNGYVPSLQTGGGVVYFMKQHLGARVPSTTMVAPLTKRFVDAMECFTETHGVDLVTFAKGQRKDDVAHEYLAAFTGEEGVLFVGKAQEKASVFRTETRHMDSPNCQRLKSLFNDLLDRQLIVVTVNSEFSDAAGRHFRVEKNESFDSVIAE